MCPGDRWFRGVVVITSALHAEGREFDPRRNLYSLFFSFKKHISTETCEVNVIDVIFLSDFLSVGRLPKPQHLKCMRMHSWYAG